MESQNDADLSTKPTKRLRTSCPDDAHHRVASEQVRRVVQQFFLPERNGGLVSNEGFETPIPQLQSVSWLEVVDVDLVTPGEAASFKRRRGEVRQQFCRTGIRLNDFVDDATFGEVSPTKTEQAIAGQLLAVLGQEPVDANFNEFVLFHGTGDAGARAVADGLSMRPSTRRDLNFGVGIYFTDDPMKAARFTMAAERNGDHLHPMIIVRASCGNIIRAKKTSSKTYCYHGGQWEVVIDPSEHDYHSNKYHCLLGKAAERGSSCSAASREFLFKDEHLVEPLAVVWTRKHHARYTAQMKVHYHREGLQSDMIGRIWRFLTHTLGGVNQLEDKLESTLRLGSLSEIVGTPFGRQSLHIATLGAMLEAKHELLLKASKDPLLTKTLDNLLLDLNYNKLTDRFEQMSVWQAGQHSPCGQKSVIKTMQESATKFIEGKSMKAQIDTALEAVKGKSQESSFAGRSKDLETLAALAWITGFNIVVADISAQMGTGSRHEIVMNREPEETSIRLAFTGFDHDDAGHFMYITGWPIQSGLGDL